MTRICPKPTRWNEAFSRLREFARFHACSPPAPPVPLILAGWIFSSDIDKMRRWAETVDWADKNGCSDLISEIPESDFIFVQKPASESCVEEYAVPAGQYKLRIHRAKMQGDDACTVGYHICDEPFARCLSAFLNLPSGCRDAREMISMRTTFMPSSPHLNWTVRLAGQMTIQFPTGSGLKGGRF